MYLGLGLRAAPRSGQSGVAINRRRIIVAWLRFLGMLCLAGTLTACGKTVVLQAGLSDADANEIVLVLDSNGIQVEKQKAKEGVNLIVKDSDLSRATGAMNSAGLPRRSLSNLGEVFKKQGMISTPLEERIRYLHGLSEELGFTLQQFDRVISARVHVVLPERVAPGEPVQPSSAAVFVKYRPPLDEDEIMPRIRKLVSASIPGLSSEDGKSKVSVIMAASELPPPAVEWTTVGPFKVLAGSAGGLLFTLIVLVLLFLVAVTASVLTIFQNHPLVAKLLKKFMRKKPAVEPAAIAPPVVAPAAATTEQAPAAASSDAPLPGGAHPAQ
ncbi:MAG: hrcJ [Burkholderia sp.]|nr:hrcJ [Burkholderia sp.]